MSVREGSSMVDRIVRFSVVCGVWKCFVLGCCLVVNGRSARVGC